MQTASVRTQSFYLKKRKKTVNSHSGQQLEMDLKKMTGKEPVIRKSVERPAHKREGGGKRRKGRGGGSQHLGDWETQPQINSQAKWWRCTCALRPGADRKPPETSQLSTGRGGG